MRAAIDCITYQSVMAECWIYIHNYELVTI